MKFTYSLNQKQLLKSIEIPLEFSGIYLISCNESVNLDILMGILGGFFPVKKEKAGLEIIEVLMENYTGLLNIIEGTLPKKISYVGPDPDRHILFSEVNEEVLLGIDYQIKNNNSESIISQVLLTLGLDASFARRRISSLSGGERMKVVLAIALARLSDCYVFHGVIPWLDKNGRDLLVQKVIQLKKEGKTIIFCDQEIEDLLPIVDQVFTFDGDVTTQIDKDQFREKYYSELKNQAHIKSPKKNDTGSKTILEFRNVYLKQHPDFDGVKKSFLFDNVSFSLNLGENYCFVGVNGVGKSTLADLIFRIFPVDSGSIFFDNKLQAQYSRAELVSQICYLGQFPEQQVILSTVGAYRKEAVAKNNLLAEALLKKYITFADDYPVSPLSFFELKLLCLASFVTEKTKLLILDEPTWGVDHKSLLIILNLLQDILLDHSVTLLIISHNELLMKALDAKMYYIERSKVLSKG
jgi:energy-coupling factor transport system ATP-binding protein